VGQAGRRLCRLQIIELFLKALNLRLVLLLDFSNFALQLLHLIVHAGRRLSRGRDRQNGAPHAGDQRTKHPYMGGISLSGHFVPREIDVSSGTLTGSYDSRVKKVNDSRRTLMTLVGVAAAPQLRHMR